MHQLRGRARSNGSVLPTEHGFPARLVAPGFYGTDSVKWLTRIRLSESRAPGPFTTRRYNDPVLDSTGRETGETTPVWSVAPESLIVSPGPDETVPRSIEGEVRGWAWADCGVRNVHVLTGGTTERQLAELEEPPGTRVAALFDPMEADTARQNGTGFAG